MSVFESILSKLGVGSQELAAAADAPEEVVETEEGVDDEGVIPDEDFIPEPIENVEEISEEISEETSIDGVDIEATLDALAESHHQPLNWRTSIVDLLKTLNLDSSLSARRELAEELECPEEDMEDSAHMNMWLHKAVLQKLAENGGQVPVDLL